MFWSIRKACCCIIVTAADVQDAAGGLALLATLFGCFPGIIVQPTAPISGRSPAPWPIILPDLETEIVKRIRCGIEG